MRRRKWVFWLAAPFLLGLAIFFVIHFLLRPQPFERTEIFEGVYLTVEDYPWDWPVKGRVMIAEIHWATPGLEIKHRDFSYPFLPGHPKAEHFSTLPADWALERESASILVNTTLFGPNSLSTWIPGSGVRSNETIVIDGLASHIHAHSYLLYWDSDDNAHMLRQKPPPPEIIETARLGIGLQGVQVNEGRPGYAALSDKDNMDDRTFIGVDPMQKILFLMAFEKSTGRFMIDRAIEEGVIFGGQLDGGSSTNLLVGPGARGIRSHTGIRNLRPIGPYLVVRAGKI